MADAARNHHWDDSFSVGNGAIDQVQDLLEYCKAGQLWHRTHAIRDVQNSSKYQDLGIDLIWSVILTASRGRIAIEVKGDRYHNTGNFAFETVSNEKHGTKGAFLKSQADWFFYCFVDQKSIYCLPLYETRQWFERNRDKFTSFRTTTTKEDSRWATVGKLVPIDVVLENISGVRKFVNADGRWVRQK